jgi:carbon monoxide dehydrogenase subunit G
MISLVFAAAFAASPYADRETNITATESIDASPEAVFAAVQDLETFREILPCASDWSFGTVTRGQGASLQLTYDIGSMHRRLNAVISQVKEPRVVDYDHAGNKGFVTRWQIAPEDSGSTVTMTTYLNPPPWPFKKMYFERIEPQWNSCYSEALTALSAKVAASPDTDDAVPEGQGLSAPEDEPAPE